MSGYAISTGDRFGRLTVVAQAEPYQEPGGRRKHPRSLCRCDCGGEKVIHDKALIHGATKSCGCFRREVTVARSTRHGNAARSNHSGAYTSWTAMLSRVDFPEKWKAKHYRERGIGVCDRWRTFTNFLADMGERPKGASLDRIDNNRSYEPGNCRWATKSEQMRNTRRNVIVEYRDRSMCLADAVRLAGLPYGTVQRRLKLGWSVERALSP